MRRLYLVKADQEGCKVLYLPCIPFFVLPEKPTIMTIQELLERLESLEEQLPEPSGEVFYLGCQTHLITAEDAMQKCVLGQMVVISRRAFRQIVQALARASALETLHSIGAMVDQETPEQNPQRSPIP